MTGHDIKDPAEIFLGACLSPINLGAQRDGARRQSTQGEVIFFRESHSGNLPS